MPDHCIETKTSKGIKMLYEIGKISWGYGGGSGGLKATLAQGVV